MRQSRILTEVVTGGVLLKKMFLKVSQISQETPVLEYLSEKAAGLKRDSTKCAFP